MSGRSPLHVLGVLLALTALGPRAVDADTTSKGKGVAYRWTDDQGVVHYGDRIPPQYATKERAVLNSQGVEVNKLDAQKTPEQAAAAERTHEDELKQKQHDAFLINTYTSVKDIEALRDVRLDQLNGQKSAAEQYVETLHSRLAALQTRARLFKPYSPNATAHRMPDDLAEDLVHTLNELHTQGNVVESKSEEEANLRAQFQADIERYRALHAASPH